MARLLPGFGSFRYPAKLLTFASLGLAASVPPWVGTTCRRGAAGVRSGAPRPCCCSACWPCMTYIFAGPASWTPGVQRFPAAGVALRRVRPHQGARRHPAPFFHGSLAALLAGFVVRAAGRFPVRSNLAALLVLTTDLIVAGRGLVPTVPQSLLDPGNTPEVLRRIEAAERAIGPSGPYRIYRMPNWYPQGWLGAPAGDRVSTMLASKRTTIQPKHALPFGASYTAVESTLELAGLFSFFNPFPAGRHGPEVSRFPWDCRPR